MIISKLVVKTGTQCTLKCEKCGEFNPYIKSHQQFSETAEHLSKQIERIQKICKIEVLHIAGGEPFIHKDLDRLITAVSVMQNIGKIEVVTNGTCKLTDSLATALREARDRVTVLVSDYSGAFVDQKEFISLLDKNGVTFKVLRDMKWKDKTDISFKAYSDDELLLIADRCSGFRDRYFSLINGIVTAHCPTSGSLLLYKEFYEKSPDMWFSVDDTADEKLAENFEFLNKKGFTPMCNYCVSNADAKDATAGKQIMSGEEWAEQFSMKSLLSLGKPIYIYGDYAKHYNRLNKWITDNGGKISGVFDIDAFSDGFLGTLPAGVVIVCEISRMSSHIINEITQNIENYHVLYDVNDLINYPHFVKCLAENRTVTNITCKICRASKRSCGIRRNAMKLMPGERAKVLPQVSIRPGHICNLKCKYCAQLIPILDAKKKACYNDEAISCINKLSKAVEFISTLAITGGETLLNPGFPEIIDSLVSLPNIGDIYTITNGTYVPKKEILDALEKHSNRITVHVNSYDINQNAKDLIAEFDKRNISYIIRETRDWIDCSPAPYQGRSVDELKYLYRYCNACYTVSNIYIYLDGKLGIRCGGANSQMFAFDKWDEFPDDWFDLLNIDVENISAAITKLENKLYLGVCNYCTGSGKAQDARCIKPAGDQVNINS